jgi:hypothetical protein
LHKRGETFASDLPTRAGMVMARLVHALHLNTVLGYLGLNLEAEGSKTEAKAGGEAGEATKRQDGGETNTTTTTTTTASQQAGKRQMDSGRCLDL